MYILCTILLCHFFIFRKHSLLFRPIYYFKKNYEANVFIIIIFPFFKPWSIHP